MALSLLGLIDFPGRVTARRMTFAGHDLRDIGNRERREVVGKDIAMVFQDPLASLDPCYTVAHQLMEALAVHGKRTLSARVVRRAVRERWIFCSRSKSPMPKRD
jgi:dipeptide transport system ATP-binding protein